MGRTITRRAFMNNSSQIFGAALMSSMIPMRVNAALAGSYTELSASAAIGAMSRGDIKAEDYARALVERASRLPSLNVFRTFNGDAVVEAAREADKSRATGGRLGMLHGLPIPVKDSVNTKSLPTSNGTRSLAGFVPTDNAAVLKPLLAEGAIIMGKTNLQELSYGWTSSNESFGPVRNPYDETRIPGGSSGGSAAAVAGRIAPLAIAEDTLGSIRIPATCCGIAGLRPTYGRYPGHGIMPLTLDKFDQVGPLARSVADLALFDRAVTGERAPIAEIPLKGVRIGVAKDYFLAGLDTEVERVTNDALRRLRDAGAIIVEVKAPDIVKAASEIAFTIITYETVPSVTAFLKQQGTGLTFEDMFAKVGPNMQGVMKALAMAPNRPSREAYEAVLAKREEFKSGIRGLFAEHNIAALAFPPIMTLPPKIGEEAEVDIAGVKVPLSVALVRNIAVGSCAAMASLVLPAGLTSSGLPVGLEFDAVAGNDRNLLALGLSLEKALGSIPAPKG